LKYSVEYYSTVASKSVEIKNRKQHTKSNTTMSRRYSDTFPYDQDDEFQNFVREKRAKFDKEIREEKERRTELQKFIDELKEAIRYDNRGDVSNME